ncbi:TAXI family TRAP transporter solute-binding subunit [Arthrobacter nitrophenolicus]|uniref:TAXI family TRAP transporter solute-binding subunit n=1 Tax=Arthrobacter nitrophenolicus TaxID=683150 RepID=A0A4R5Y580_9MICC|nr:TAXI family TRAP transporter solute-binding subunit [Arthrobacter nitrophenolicus]TDL39644.1 TAXI family TRAP transporter solute-binding subunit [Arthrobacter nitrophenolicus]
MTPHQSATISRRRLLAAAPAAAAALALPGCSTPDRRFTLGTAEPRGFFYDFGQSLTAAVARAKIGFSLDPRITDGSVENLAGILSGKLDFSLVLADVALTERNRLHAVGRLYLNYLQFAVPANSSIRSISELRGRTVSLGASSATIRAGHLLLKAGGVPESEVNVKEVAVTRVLDALASGEVDAALFAGGVPHPQMETSGGRGPVGGIRLIDLAGEQRILQAEYGPVYQPVTLPMSLYSSGTEIASVGISTLLLARPDLPNDVVSGVVGVLIRRSAELVPPGTVGVQFLDPRSLIYTSGVPLHAGAAEAYRRNHA